MNTITGCESKCIAEELKFSNPESSTLKRLLKKTHRLKKLPGRKQRLRKKLEFPQATEPISKEAAMIKWCSFFSNQSQRRTNI